MGFSQLLSPLSSSPGASSSINPCLGHANPRIFPTPPLVQLRESSPFPKQPQNHPSSSYSSFFFSPPTPKTGSSGSRSPTPGRCLSICSVGSWQIKGEGLGSREAAGSFPRHRSGAELLLAQHSGPPDFISGVLSPRLIGFAVVRVIYGSSKSPPGWDFSRDSEPGRPGAARSGGKRRPGVLGQQILGYFSLGMAGREPELKFGRREDFIFHFPRKGAEGDPAIPGSGRV